jgi:isopentenyldiphosphate isomerase
MTQRYMKDLKMNDGQLKQLRNSMKMMFFIFLGHTLLVFYSAFFMSKEAWVFISGGLFYILFGLVFLIELLKQKRKQKNLLNEEWLPLVDEQGQITGKAPRSQCHLGEKLLHPVVHLHVINKNKAIFLQKRPMDKLVQPGKWDTAVGGHISFGEKLEDSLKREAWEEIGLKDFSARLVKTYRWETEIEAELVYVFVTYDFKNINIHSEEVEEGRFWTKNQVEKNTGKEIFTPNFEYEYKILKGIL